MEMIPVKSTALDSVGYDPATRRMHITFRGGRTYEFPDISPERHKALIDAPSKGEHVADNFAGGKLVSAPKPVQSYRHYSGR